MLRLLFRRPRLIGIIDGYFETVPAVWHKEILYAMSRGVHVLGAASMGALRAAELEPFGMVGVGRIFEAYRSGLLEDDDEVAVAHGSADSSYAPVSETMVNIRDAAHAASVRGLLPADLERRFLALAKGLHYPSRHYRRILQLMEGDIDPALAAQLLLFLENHSPRLKERDAILMLQHAASFLACDPPPLEVAYSVERTVFLDAMISDAETNAAEADAPQEGSGQLRHEVLLRLLARREATRLGLECSDAEVREAADTFAQALSFHDPDAMGERLRSAGISEDSFQSMMNDAMLLEKLDHFYNSDIASRLADHIRIRTFRRSTQAAG